MFDSSTLRCARLFCTFGVIVILSSHLQAQATTERISLLVKTLVESKPNKNVEGVLREYRDASKSLTEADFKGLATWLTTCSNSEFYVGMKFLLTTRNRVYNAFSDKQREVLYRIFAVELSRSMEFRRRVVSYVQWERDFILLPNTDDKDPQKKLDSFLGVVGALVAQSKSQTSPENNFRRAILASIFGFKFGADEWLGKGSKFEEYLMRTNFQLTPSGIWSPVTERSGSIIASFEEGPVDGQRLEVPPKVESPFPGDKRLLEVIEKLEL
jgi:hypothetical protein